MLARFFLGAFEVCDHTGPGRFVVVGTVDTHAIHTCIEKIAHQIIIAGCFAGHGNHNSHVSLGWLPA